MLGFHSAGKQICSFLDKAMQVHTRKVREGTLKAEGNGYKVLGVKSSILPPVYNKYFWSFWELKVEGKILNCLG